MKRNQIPLLRTSKSILNPHSVIEALDNEDQDKNCEC